MPRWPEACPLASRLGLSTTGRQDGQGPPVLFTLTNSGRGTPEPNTSLSLESLTHRGQNSDMLHHPALLMS